MKVKTLFIITAFLGLITGIGFLFLSGFLLRTYGITSNPGAILLCRFFGGAILGQAIIAWAASHAPDSPLKQACLMCFLVNFSIGTVITLVGLLSGILSSIAWSGVVIFLLLTLAFAYFRFAKTNA